MEFTEGIFFGGVCSDVASMHGGYTTSYGLRLLTKEGVRVGIVVDNGTGVVNVLKNFRGFDFDKRILVQTHYHMDHLAGIQGNDLLTKSQFDQIISPDLSACGGGGKSLRKVADTIYVPPFWPIGVLFAEENFVPSDTLNFVGIKKPVRTTLLPHPNGSTGYRIGTYRRDIVIATDSEFATPQQQEAFANFIDGAQHVIIDMKYMDGTYMSGWGHNSTRLIIETFSRVSDLKGCHILLVHRDNNQVDTDNIHDDALLRIAEALTEKNLGTVRYAQDNMNVSFD